MCIRYPSTRFPPWMAPPADASPSLTERQAALGKWGSPATLTYARAISETIPELLPAYTSETIQTLSLRQVFFFIYSKVEISHT